MSLSRAMAVKTDAPNGSISERSVLYGWPWNCGRCRFRLTLTVT